MRLYGTTRPNPKTGLALIVGTAASFGQNEPEYVWFFTDSLTAAFRICDYKTLQLLEEFHRGLWLQRRTERAWFSMGLAVCSFIPCAGGILQCLHTRCALPCWYCGHAPVMDRWSIWWSLCHPTCSGLSDPKLFACWVGQEQEFISFLWQKCYLKIYLKREDHTYQQSMVSTVVLSLSSPGIHKGKILTFLMNSNVKMLKKRGKGMTFMVVLE